MKNNNPADIYVQRYGTRWSHPESACYLSGEETGVSEIKAWNTRPATPPAGSREPAQVKAILESIPVHAAVNNGTPRTEREEGWNAAMDWIVDKFEHAYSLAGSRAAAAEHVGDTNFEGWLSTHQRTPNRLDYYKQDMRDCYWAGYLEARGQR
ncbi:MAG TPA: hypothetical protein VNU71_05260 [Burkholderiaceae bacterium]|nr:hypothetical protein [Burkholderiaceae bacterium]